MCHSNYGQSGLHTNILCSLNLFKFKWKSFSYLLIRIVSIEENHPLQHQRKSLLAKARHEKTGAAFRLGKEGNMLPYIIGL